MLSSITIRAKDLSWLDTWDEIENWCIKVSRLNQLAVEMNVLPSAPVVRIGSDQEFNTRGGYACPYFPIPQTQADVAYLMNVIAEVMVFGWGDAAHRRARVYVIFRDAVRSFAQGDIDNRSVEFRETSSEYDLQDALVHHFALDHLTIDATNDVGKNAYLYAFAKLFPFFDRKGNNPEDWNDLDLVFQKTGSDDSDILLGRKLLAETLETAPNRDQIYRGPYVMAKR